MFRCSMTDVRCTCSLKDGSQYSDVLGNPNNRYGALMHRLTLSCSMSVAGATVDQVSVCLNPPHLSLDDLQKECGRCNAGHCKGKLDMLICSYILGSQSARVYQSPRMIGMSADQQSQCQPLHGHSAHMCTMQAHLAWSIKLILGHVEQRLAVICPCHIPSSVLQAA